MNKEIEKEAKFSLTLSQYESFLAQNFSHQETYTMHYFDTEDDAFLNEGSTFRNTFREDSSKNRITFKKFLYADGFRVCEETHWKPEELSVNKKLFRNFNHPTMWDYVIHFEGKKLYKKSEVQTTRRHLILPDLKAELDKCVVKDSSGAEIKTFYEIELEDQNIPIWLSLYTRDDKSKYAKSRI